MKLLLVTIAALSVALGNAGLVQKRNLVAFGLMVLCEGDLSLAEGAEYDGYGCYCGLGGSGTVLDDTDSCCFDHDNCYGDSGDSDVGCRGLDMYLITYDYETIVDSNGDCAITCKSATDYPADDNKAKCKAHMCQCDLVGSRCFADNRSTFNPALVNHDKGTC